MGEERAVSVTNISIQGKQVVNITNKLNGKYPYLGGFTVAGGLFVFAARKSDNYGKLFTISISGGTLSEPATTSNLEHGNDVAYYSNAYYLARGGGGIKTTEIQQFSASDLLPTRLFSYVPLNASSALKNVTKICQYSGTKFILGVDRDCSLCNLDSASLRFKELSRFTLPDDTTILKRDNYPYRSGQGIFYTNNRIYNIFSYRKSEDDPFLCNDIAVYVPNASGDTLSPTLEKVYRCDAPSAIGATMDLFEIEGIAADTSNFYIAMNLRDANKNACDAIYPAGYLYLE